MNEKENLSKQQAFQIAHDFWKCGDAATAETYAIRAMKLGSKTSAPELLAEIAEKTKSKHTAITLAHYYWEHKNIPQTAKWATHAQKFGSQTLAPALLDAVEAHQKALALQLEVENFSPPADEESHSLKSLRK